MTGVTCRRASSLCTTAMPPRPVRARGSRTTTARPRARTPAPCTATRASCPVLVMRRRADAIRRLVIGLDGSAEARRAVTFGRAPRGPHPAGGLLARARVLRLARGGADRRVGGSLEHGAPAQAPARAGGDRCPSRVRNTRDPPAPGPPGHPDDAGGADPRSCGPATGSCSCSRASSSVSARREPPAVQGFRWRLAPSWQVSSSPRASMARRPWPTSWRCATPSRAFSSSRSGCSSIRGSRSGSRSWSPAPSSVFWR